MSRASKGNRKGPVRKGSQASSPPPVGSRSVSKGRLWGYRLILALGVPIGFIAALEGGLRGLDVGYPTDFFLPSSTGSHWIENDRFAWQFYSPNSRLKAHPFRLKRQKETGTIRIFALGGSAALGTPESAYGFVRILERMLSLKFPDQEFEVINAAMPGINSHLVRSIARDCAQREPDLFLVYMGNNELVGLHAPGPDSRGLTGRLWLLRLIQDVRSSRIGQLMAPMTKFLAPRQPEGEQDMAFFRNHRLAADDPGRQAVYDNFRQNLTDVVEAARRSQAKCILSTVAVNLRDCPPLGSLHRPGLIEAERNQWEGAFQRGGNHLSLGNHEEALAEYSKAEAIDSAYAELIYRMGICRSRLNQGEAAAEAFSRARDLDALPFRADSGLNEVVRELGAQFPESDGVLLESDRELAALAEAPANVPGFESFYEHVHFRFAGDYRIATLFFREVQRLLSARLGLQGSEVIAPPSLEDCARALAYNRLNEGLLESSIMDMTTHAPFLDQMGHEARIAAARAHLKEQYGDLQSEDVAIAFQAYQEAMARFPDDWNLSYLLARLHFKFHHFDAARDHLKRAVELMPHVLEVRLGYTRALVETGQFEEAFRQIERLEGLAPGSKEVQAARSTARARQAAQRSRRSE